MQEYAGTLITAWFLWIIIRVMMKTAIKHVPENGTLDTNTKHTEPTKNKTPAPVQQKSNTAGGNAISILCRRMAGSNWQNAPESKPQQQQQTSAVVGAKVESKNKRKKQLRTEKWTKFVSMDCEMVGIGPEGQDDMLARVSIVNQNGDVLLDKYVKAQEEVVDYRTKISGIRPHDMENGEDFDSVQQEVKQILGDKVLVGHSVRHDLAVLRLSHPNRHIRDTAKYRPLAKLVSNGRTPSLKRLAKAILGMDIQTGEHSSVEDARACMLVYVRVSAEWERCLKKLNHRSHQVKSHKS